MLSAKECSTIKEREYQARKSNIKTFLQNFMFSKSLAASTKNPGTWYYISDMTTKPPQ